MKINKLIMLTSLMISSVSFAENISQSLENNQQPQTIQEIVLEKMSPSEKATIISGDQEARQKISTRFLYEENKIYNIYCRANNITSILLNPDENVVSIQAGDTARWDVIESATGSSEGQRTVIMIKPLQFQERLLKTTLMVLTDKRYYTFNLVSAKDWYNPVVKFLYPQEMKKALEKKLNSEELVYKTDPANLHNNYSVSTKRYEFSPSSVYDDGNKTFIVMKKELQEMPAFYVKNGKELLLVNYRTKGNYIIIDRTFKEGVLMLGKKRVIIKRKG